MCAISKNSDDWDCSESEGKRPKPTPLPHMRLWCQGACKTSLQLRLEGKSKETDVVLPKSIAHFQK